LKDGFTIFIRLSFAAINPFQGPYKKIVRCFLGKTGSIAKNIMSGCSLNNSVFIPRFSPESMDGNKKQILVLDKSGASSRIE
jgi:hypothetical protein